uniref:Uncharacterized protein n=1 Tax=Anguilla anguilla TaxID=7936 RepID=A0A0E9W8G2_ANGAN
MTFIQGHPVAPHSSEDQGVAFFTVPVKLHSKQGLPMVFLQTVDTLEGVFALFGFPLALSPALSPWCIGRVGGRVWALRVCPTLNADRVIIFIT